jgi:hypothetical protein
MSERASDGGGLSVATNGQCTHARLPLVASVFENDHEAHGLDEAKAKQPLASNYQ